MKVLSLAWKYHPSITSGVGVACEGLNNALSKLVELKVIYPSVSSVKVKKEELLTFKNLDKSQQKAIEKEYTQLTREGHIELALRFDPYFTPSKKQSVNKEKQVIPQDDDDYKSRTYKKEIITEKPNYNDVDVFGESVRDKIFLYNRLVEELSGNLEFDIIHAHDWMTFLAGINLKNMYGKALVLHVHSLEYDRVGHKDASWVYDIERFAMSKADCVLVASNYTRDIIKSNYGLSGDHLRVVRHAVTLPENELLESSKNHGSFKVLFAGRIDGNKGLEYFIKIAGEVLKNQQDAEFIVVGRGKGDVQFDKIEGFEFIERNFKYLGFVDREKLFDLYHSVDVLCMPSISEPFGLTALEAAYVGLPVVLSSKTGAAEILPHTPKADFWNISLFSQHILAFRDSTFRQRVVNVNKKDVENLSWEKSARHIKKIYDDLL